MPRLRHPLRPSSSDLSTPIRFSGNRVVIGPLANDRPKTVKISEIRMGRRRPAKIDG
jgi:hypothetical protein